MPNYTRLHRKSSELDADFMMVHHRVKTAAEQIAFFDGGQREREIVEESHAALMDHQWKINWMNFKLGLVQDVFQSRIPDVFQWVLRFGYGYLYGGTDAEVLADGGAMLNKNQTYLMAVLPQISNNLGAAIGLSTRFAEIAGQIVRVAEFQEVLDELEEQQVADAARASKRTDSGDSRKSAEGGSVVHDGIYTGTTEPKITLDDVTIVTPAGECITTGLTCQVTPGSALMCTGRSASGKSSVVRAISGLWPIMSGRVEVYNTTGGLMPSLQDLFVIPQQLLMASGTLADQITYPDSIDPEDRSPEKEAGLLKLLEDVGIDYLVKRWGERDAGADDEYGLRRVGRQRGKEWDAVFAMGGLAHLRKAGVGRAAGQAQANAGSGVGWNREARWEDVLSLGEQQRMGIARMLYHKPRFAVLDECTSAVSVDAEEQLYRSAMTSGTTCLTVSQRMTLPKFHKNELKVGINAASGWSLEPIAEGQENQLSSGNLDDAMHVTAELH
jgi:ABC-type uncharacterized transport system fused permease/ATPase subunit